MDIGMEGKMDRTGFMQSETVFLNAADGDSTRLGACIGTTGEEGMA
jgi:hypothetical protein